MLKTKLLIFCPDTDENRKKLKDYISEKELPRDKVLFERKSHGNASWLELRLKKLE